MIYMKKGINKNFRINDESVIVYLFVFVLEEIVL